MKQVQKQQITSTDLNTIRPVFAQGFNENIRRYKQIKGLFQKNKEYLIFAEPTLEGGNKINWFTEYEGEIIPFAKLTPEEQEYNKRRLKHEVNRLYINVLQKQAGGNDRRLIDDLFEVLDSCFEIPDYNDLYIIKAEGDVTHFVITRWGFISDDFNAQNGLIAQLVPLKVNSILFKIVFTDNTIARNEMITFQFAGKTQTINSGESGEVFLEDIPLFSNIKAWQTNNEGQNINIHEWVCDHREEHTMRLKLYAKDMIFEVKDDKGRSVPNSPFVFEYKGEKVELSTNSEGKVVLPNIMINTQIKAYQIVNGEAWQPQDFICKNDKDVYQLKGTMPLAHMRIRLIDERERPLADEKMKCEIEGQIIEKVTDGNGYFMLENVEVGAEVLCSQMANNEVLSSHNLQCEQFKNEYIIIGIRQTKNITIKALDQAGQIIPNAPFVFEFDGNKVELTTDENGLVQLNNVPLKDNVYVNQLVNGEQKHPQNFVCTADKNEYTINGEIPAVPEILWNMKVKVLDSKRQIIPGLNLFVEHRGNTFNRITANDGTTILSNLKPNTNINFKIEHNNKTYNKTIQAKKDNDEQVIILGGKGCILWWLIPLLLILLGLLLWWYYENHYKKPTPEPKPIVVDTVKPQPNPPVVVGDLAKLNLEVFDQKTKEVIPNAKVKITSGTIILNKTTNNLGKVSVDSINKKQYVSVEIEVTGYPRFRSVFPYEPNKKVYINKEKEEDVSEIPIPCNVPTQSGGFGTTIKVYDMNKTSGRFFLKYTMYTIPDEMFVYNGKPEDMSPSNLIWTTKGPVSGSKKLTLRFNSANHYITVKVVGKKSNTSWNYNISCPE